MLKKDDTDRFFYKTYLGYIDEIINNIEKNMVKR